MRTVIYQYRWGKMQNHLKEMAKKAVVQGTQDLQRHKWMDKMAFLTVNCIMRSYKPLILPQAIKFYQQFLKCHQGQSLHIYKYQKSTQLLFCQSRSSSIYYHHFLRLSPSADPPESSSQWHHIPSSFSQVLTQTHFPHLYIC